MPIPMPTEQEFRKFAPKAREEYVRSFMAGEEYLREAGVLDSNLTLTHFLAQAAAETGGFTILRENMNYTTVSRIRAVWRARASKHSDAWIARNLLKNPVQLSDWAYGGRLSNRKGTTDGYDFRGGSWFQTTGRYNVAKYAKALDIPMRADLLDDHEIGLRFACFEWKDGNCCRYANENDLLSISKYINTGSAKSGIMPNGLADRKAWYAKAWKVWGDARPLPAVSDVTVSQLKAAGSVTIADAETLKKLGAGATAASAAAGAVKEALGPPSAPASSDLPLSLIGPVTEPSMLDRMREWTDYSNIFNAFASAMKGSIELVVSNVWVLLMVLGCVAYLIARRLQARRTLDARLYKNTARLPGEGDSPSGVVATRAV
jgi:predicted chitinase